MTDAGRRRAFWAIALVCVAAVAVTLLAAIRSERESSAAERRATATASGRVATALASGTPMVVFRSLDRRTPAKYGRLAFAPLTRPDGPRVVSGMTCDRVAFAARRGLCLRLATGLGAVTDLAVLDERLRTLRELRVAGIPSRARVSPDGRLGAVTTFVSGHSYADPGEFSTAALIFDLESGRRLGTLERWPIVADGRRLRSPDINVWGVTFHPDGRRFFATVATKGKTHLVEGDLRARRMRVLRDNVECPSLSPDGTRIAFKKLVGRDTPVWRFHVLDLATGKETPLAETRPIDDQIAWLDDRTVLYGVDETTWRTPADGSGRPRQFLAAGNSPTVVG